MLKRWWNYRRHPRIPDNTGNLISAGNENDFSAAYWSKTNCTVTAEAHPILDTIWRITDSVDGSAVRHGVDRTSDLHTDDLFHRKLLVKAGSWPFLTLSGRSGAFGANGFGVNMRSGQLFYPGGGIPIFSRAFFGDGWWDVDLIMSVDDASSVSDRIGFGFGTGVSTSVQTYQGAGDRDFYACYARAILP